MNGFVSQKIITKTTEESNGQGKHLVNMYISCQYIFWVLFDKGAHGPWLLTKLISSKVCMQTDINC